MFCSTIKDIIYKEFNMNAHISIRFKDRITSTRTLKVCGKQMFRFLEWMYKDSNIHLHRKYLKYLSEIEKLPNWPILNKVNQHR